MKGKDMIKGQKADTCWVGLANNETNEEEGGCHGNTCALKIRLAGTWRDAERVIPLKSNHISGIFFTRIIYRGWQKLVYS